MKRFFRLILFFVLVLSLMPKNIYAWERHSDTTLLIGFRGGINSSRTLIGLTETGKMNSMNLNLMASLHLVQEITLHTGLGIHKKAWSELMNYTDIFNNPIGMHTTYNEFTYLNIPFSMQYNMGRKRINVYLTGGIDFNFLTAHRRWADLPDFHNDVRVEPFDESYKDMYKGFGIGYHAGLGVEYKIYPALRVFADFRYYNDFTNNDKYISLPELKHRYYSLSIGMRIGIPIKFIV